MVGQSQGRGWSRGPTWRLGISAGNEYIVMNCDSIKWASPALGANARDCHRHAPPRTTVNPRRWENIVRMYYCHLSIQLSVYLHKIAFNNKFASELGVWDTPMINGCPWLSCMAGNGIFVHDSVLLHPYPPIANVDA
ncbi:hypothetical protein QVD17_36017 [Tagetes erecta]|uniref:Uncharacterized protein n=1 Tax=Tagetes erecta TaxID=13708 RepID=A0AAD8JTR4_TARER|nr:hypothetical protein QVD17_36017 [Tagetes erecta]